jgi:hypothetical protein
MATPKKKPPAKVKTPVKGKGPAAKAAAPKTPAKPKSMLQNVEDAVGGVGNKIKQVYQSGVDARENVGRDLVKVKNARAAGG